jgi:hypothetical protein
VKDERAVAVVIQWLEKRDALDVVPVKVGKENMGVDWVAVLAISSVLQGELLAQIAESGATIKNVDVPVDADFNTGGIAAVTQVF